MVQGIDNIGICTTDLTRSVTFYERLGFSEAYRNDRGVMMAAGTVQLFLFQVRRPDPAPVGRELGLFGNPPGIAHISFAGPTLTRSMPSFARPAWCRRGRPRISRGARAWSAWRGQTVTTSTFYRGSKNSVATTRSLA